MKLLILYSYSYFTLTVVEFRYIPSKYMLQVNTRQKVLFKHATHQTQVKDDRKEVLVTEDQEGQ